MTLDPNNLPYGWTVRPSRFMWCLCKDDTPQSFGLTEEAVRNAIHLQPEFYEGIVNTIKVDKHVDL